MNEKNFSLLCALYAAAWHDSCDGGLIIRDPLSRRMLTEEEYTEITRQLIDSVPDEGKAEKIRTTNADRLRTAMYRENGLLSFYMPRRRFFTQTLTNGMRIGVRQYVSICGGLEPCCIAEDIAGDRLRVYEIERASAAREKRERLKNAGIPAPGHCTVAEADFPYDDPAAALEGTGFDRNKKTVFAVPGFFGIEREEALTLLRSLYETAAPGSSLIFDFVLPGAPESVPDTGGIPVRQRLSPEQTEQMLNDAGWSVYDLSEGIQIGREYVEPSRLPIRIPPFLGLVNAVRFR